MLKIEKNVDKPSFNRHNFSKITAFEKYNIDVSIYINIILLFGHVILIRDVICHVCDAIHRTRITVQHVWPVRQCENVHMRRCTLRSHITYNVYNTIHENVHSPFVFSK